MIKTNSSVVDKTTVTCVHLQEILAYCAPTTRNVTLLFGNRSKNAEFLFAIGIDIHNRSNVAAAIAVVRSAPDGDHIFGREVVL